MSDIQKIELFDDLHITSQLSDRSKATYRSDAKIFAEWLLDHDIHPDTMTRRDMLLYREYLSQKYTNSTATPQRMLSVAKRILKQKDLDDAGPLESIEGFEISESYKHIALKYRQVEQLLSSVDTSKPIGVRDYTLLVFLLQTGVRRFECEATKISDLQQSDDKINLIIQHGKGNKRRLIPIEPDVFEIIQDYMMIRKINSLDDPIFVSFDSGGKPTDRKLGEKQIERIVQKYGDKIGIQNPRLLPHSLRATFITLLFEEGVPLERISYLAGHKDPKITIEYNKRRENAKDNSISKLQIKWKR